MLKFSLKLAVNLSKSNGFETRGVLRTFSQMTRRSPLFKHSENLPQNKIIVRGYKKAGGSYKVGSGGYLLLIVPITTFGLGCWQVQRKVWKESLIKEMEEKTNAEPAPLPDNLSDLNQMEYRPVVLKGHFLHDREIYMGPRSLMDKGDSISKSSLFSEKSSGIGFLVVTPFKLEGREEIILINRGWIPKNQMNPSTRESGQINGPVEITGIVRLNENRPPLSPDGRGTHFLYRDLKKMCQKTGADPYFVDARTESNVPGGPIGGQTRVTLRNEHMSYIITWFCLSGATSYVWYRQVFRRLPAF